MLMKRLFDIFFSFFGLIIFSPVLVPVCIIVFLQDFSSPFYLATRIGKNEKPFTMLKLRSMTINADKTGVDSTSANDMRITLIGHFIRNYKLDELTQLCNVFLGEMSLVGPRPLFQKHIQKLSKFHKQRLMVKPGLTGLSQIYMRSNLLSQKSLDMEVKYVKNNSLLLDLKIMVKTIKVIAKREGVFH